MLKYFPPMRIVFVMCNPVDQMCEKLLARYGHDAIRRIPYEIVEAELDGLATSVLHQAECLRAAALSHGHSFRVCNNENFVLAHKTTGRLLGDWLGFKPRLSGYRNLDFSVFLGNIGISDTLPSVTSFLVGHSCSVLYEETREVRLCGG